MAKRRLKWEKAEVIEKIQQWVKDYGEIPAATDWNPSDCRRSSYIATERARRWADRADRFSQGVYPWPRTVQDLFGSWNNAIAAAGFTPRRIAIEDLKPRRDHAEIFRDLEGAYKSLAESKTKERRIAALHNIASLALEAAEGESL